VSIIGHNQQRLAQQVLKVQSELKAHRARRAIKVGRAYRVLKVLRVSRVSRVIRAYRAQLVLRDLPALRGTKD